MHRDKIALIYFSQKSVDEWSSGQSIAVRKSPKDVASAIDTIVNDAGHEWVLIWDYAFGTPDKDLIGQLTKKPIDAWHAGLRLGLGGLPDVLNYVHPTWLYNKDASEEIEHSSFRLSIRACLIRTAALSKIKPLSASYSSLAMFGIALGYKLLKHGGIMRYHPGLLKTNQTSEAVFLKDEWIFAREFFPTKWQLWSLLSKSGYTANLREWFRMSKIRTLALKPGIHPSDLPVKDAKVETVSVLAPTLNRYSYLMNELEQLSKQTILPLEVLITDQTNEHERRELDFSRYSNLVIKYFPQDEKGQCLAWNKLLQEAKGDYVLFLGDDADDIKPDFIEKLLSTRQRFDCDMVASNVIEIGMPVSPVNPYYYMSDTFPITLIKRSVVEKAGCMDMFYNKNIRADHDLAMRCHLNGALMIFDSSATILHHRAPSGGLRIHKARVITNSISKNSITKFAIPASSEIYLAKKYYSPLQYKSYIRIKYLNQLLINGNVFRKLLRVVVFIYKLPFLFRSYQVNRALAENALNDIDK